MKLNSKTTTDGLMQIDIRQLIKQGAIKPGGASTLSWSKGGEYTGHASYAVTANDSITLQYLRLINSEWLSVNESIQLTSTSCHLGGSRQWFLCPHCAKRIAILYFTDTRFSCRHCHTLSYQSQNETVADRQRRKARKIRVKLGASSSLFMPVLDRPKGMHYNKFDRLCAAEMKANKLALHSQLNHKS